MLDDRPVEIPERNVAERDARIAAVVNLGIGLWLVASPWVLGYGRDDSWWNPTVSGLIIALFAGGRLAGEVTEPGLARANLVMGLWLIASCFWLPPSGGAALNNATAGALVVLMSVFALAAARARDRG
jgi:hypothetical protein